MSANNRVLTTTEISMLLSLQNTPPYVRTAFLLMVYYYFTPSQVSLLKYSDLIFKDGQTYLKYYLKSKNSFVQVPLVDELADYFLGPGRRTIDQLDAPLIHKPDGTPAAAIDIQEAIINYGRQIGVQDCTGSLQINDEIFNTENVIDITRSQYQTITIIEANEIRYLFTDYSISATMDIKRQSFYLQAHQLPVRLVELIDFSPREILILGGGVMVIPAYFKIVFPDVNVEVCEIDREMLMTAQKHFFFEPSSNIDIVIDDAYSHLRRTPKKYSIIFFDIPCLNQESKQRFLGIDNFIMMKSLLSEDGLLIINVLDFFEQADGEVTHKEYENIKKIFPCACLLRSSPDAKQSQNLIILAGNDSKLLDLGYLRSQNRELNRGLDNILNSIVNVSKNYL